MEKKQYEFTTKSPGPLEVTVDLGNGQTHTLHVSLIVTGVSRDDTLPAREDGAPNLALEGHVAVANLKK